MKRIIASRKCGANLSEFILHNAQRRRSQRGALFVLMFERQRVTQKVRSVGCRSAADCYARPRSFLILNSWPQNEVSPTVTNSSGNSTRASGGIIISDTSPIGTLETK